MTPRYTGVRTIDRCARTRFAGNQYAQPGRPTVEEMQAYYESVGATESATRKRLRSERVHNDTKALIRRLRRTNSASSLMKRFGITRQALNAICDTNRIRQPVEDDRGHWFEDVYAAGDAVNVSPQQIRNALSGCCTRAGWRRWVKSRHMTREAFEAARICASNPTAA